ncbi:hypothetical protein [Arthrobacter sp. JSM 101049]|uniref:hypothetical protein n=1 Tax=Arthrobacter sp. JSM 101049 TaxID=929097 RepID=UPI003564D614
MDEETWEMRHDMNTTGAREAVSAQGDGQPLPFALPDYLSAEADPWLIGPDSGYFAALEQNLRGSISEAADRLEAARKLPAGLGQEARERDMEIHRLGNRLRALRRYGLDLCLGRMVRDDGGAPVCVGRLGLTDPSGVRLLIDWRSPAAEPFFGATHADPMVVASRRRYRWSRGLITDDWDEAFTPGGLEAVATLDDQSAFIASLADSRGDRMRDVLGTIQAGRDAIIRAGSQGALVVDGGPGTGKTLVVLHRTAYLLYADPASGTIAEGCPVRRHHGWMPSVGVSRGRGIGTCPTVPVAKLDGCPRTTQKRFAPRSSAPCWLPDRRAPGWNLRGCGARPWSPRWPWRREPPSPSHSSPTTSGPMNHPATHAPPCRRSSPACAARWPPG